MKKKLIFIALLTVLLTFSFMSCEEVDEGDDGVPKTLVVTGITGFENNPTITVALAHYDKEELKLDAYNQANYAETVTIPLVSYITSVQFTGTGPFYILIYVDVKATKNDLKDDDTYAYTGGGLTPIPYRITEAETKIAFSQFAKQ